MRLKKKKKKNINNFMLRQAWTVGSPVSFICTDRTERDKDRAWKTEITRSLTSLKSCLSLWMFPEIYIFLKKFFDKYENIGIYVLPLIIRKK